MCWLGKGLDGGFHSLCYGHLGTKDERRTRADGCMMCLHSMAALGGIRLLHLSRGPLAPGPGLSLVLPLAHVFTFFC